MLTLEAIQEQTHQERDAFADQLFQSANGFFDICAVYLGDRLGLYRALATRGALTSVQLAEATGTAERYIREWLEQQAVSGVVSVDNPHAEAADRRFRLPAAHAEVLADPDSLGYLAPLARLVVSVARPLHSILRAFRTGEGVPFEDYGPDLRQGQGDLNRPAFLRQLGPEWIPVMEDVHRRLLSDPPARIADIGCGCGWSSLGMAMAYPNVRVDGFDLDRASILETQANAEVAGLAGRVRFHHRDAGDPALRGRYDLVVALECVHDMSNPVEVLRTMSRLAGRSGAVLIMDERTQDRFAPETDDLERFLYGCSVLHCLPAGMCESHSAGTGTVMRADTLRGYARKAGFRDVEILPIDHAFFRFYRLYP